MGMKSKFKNFFLLEDEYEYMEEEKKKELESEQEAKRPGRNQRVAKQNVVSLTKRTEVI